MFRGDPALTGVSTAKIQAPLKLLWTFKSGGSVMSSPAIVGDRVFFEVDQSTLTDSARGTLAQQATWLNTNVDYAVIIEGHADERGTRDYNLALGERRANSAKNFLVSIGVDASRIQTVSYGKERPSALGSDEQAWAQNRRAVTVTIR
jgi:peptidoglycan-associated lipoprotein